MGANHERRAAVIRFIDGYTQLYHYPPSFSEIGMAVGLSSKSTIHGMLHRMADDGLLTIEPCKVRAVEPTDEGRKLLECDIDNEIQMLRDRIAELENELAMYQTQK